jgi:hypothetical protein
MMMRNRVAWVAASLCCCVVAGCGSTKSLRGLLGGDGIGNITFGQVPDRVTSGLERLLGRPASASQGEPRNPLVRSICGFDHEIDWTGLAARSNGANSDGLIAYFKHSRFVGYSYGPPYGGPHTPAGRHGLMLSTSHGLGLDEALARGRRLYQQSFVVTEQPQGTPPNPRLERLPAWEARTASGRIYGFVDSPGGPQSTSKRVIGSISAGATPNTPCRSSTGDAASLIGRRQMATLALPHGPATRTFRIQAFPAHPYDVTVEASASAQLSIHMNTSAGARFVLDTIHGQSCHAHAGHIGCLLHFAAGGTSGGKWTVVITKTSAPPAAAAVSVVFIR